MSVSFIDDWLDIEFCDNLFYHILYFMPHSYGQRSEYGKSTQRFYNVDFSHDAFHVKYMCSKLSKEVIKLDCRFLRVYANIQFKGMDGAFHNDAGDFTILYMVAPTLDGSGQFQYVDEKGAVQEVDFVQNRLIWFAGRSLKHRGLSPDTDLPRITVAFKVDKERDTSDVVKFNEN